MPPLAHPASAIPEKVRSHPAPTARGSRSSCPSPAGMQSSSPRLPGTDASSTAFAPDLAHVEHRRTGVVRAAMCCRSLGVSFIRIAGALRLQDFRPAVVMQTGINRGSRTPSREATSNDLSGRCNRGSRTLDTAVMSCLLYPTELHCSGGHGCVLRRYTQQQSRSAPVWLEPQPLAPDVDQDLGDDERCSRSSKFG